MSVVLSELDAMLARIQQMISECPPAYAGQERRS